MSLNAEQQKAVEHIEGPLLVLAGAGSGKTRIVTHRIAHLLQKGVLPEDILAVTFTNKAAEEMKKRVSSLTGKKVLTCTFHSLGARILRESISFLGYLPNFTIYDEEDSQKLLKTCLESLKIKEEKGMVKSLKGKISSCKNDLLKPEEILEKDSTPSFYQIYALYQERLKECNAVDFDDLLYLTVQLLQNDKNILHTYQNRWLFILIDEYQDTNHAQYILTKLLVSSHKNLFAVGDPDQSIYSWRGAKYQNILRFSSDFEGASILALEQNYRSTDHILQAANGLISHNPDRFEKNLWSALGEGEKISLFYAPNEREETSYLFEKISFLQKEKQVPLEEMVIFYRTNAQSRIFEDLLLSKNIPYQIIGGISFYQRKEIKDVLSFAKMILSSSDIISFTRTLFVSQKGIGKTSLQKIIHLAQEKKESILSFCETNLSTLPISKPQKDSLQNYLFLIRKLQEKKESQVLFILEAILQESAYFSYLKQEEETYQERKENIEALLSKAAEWQETNEEGSLVDFLEEISLQTKVEKNSSGIKLMTLHNSKGLEFEAVFIAGLEEDLLPHINSKEDPSQLEEERRLFYVGITRAKKYLYLCSCVYRYIWGSPRIMHPSRFLEELPEEHIQKESQKKSSFPVKRENSFSFSQKQEEATFQAGSKVRHAEFGEGVIQKVYHTSYGTTYDVFFLKSQTRRSLVAKYAKLSAF